MSAISTPASASGKTRRRVKVEKPAADSLLPTEISWVLNSSPTFKQNDMDVRVAVDVVAAVLNEITENKPLCLRKIGPGTITTAAVIKDDEKHALPIASDSGPILTSEEEIPGVVYARAALMGDEVFQIHQVRVGKMQGVILHGRAQPGMLTGINKVTTIELNLKEALSSFMTDSPGPGGMILSLKEVFAKAMEKIGSYQGAVENVERLKLAAKMRVEMAVIAAKREETEKRADDYGEKGWGTW